jgi:hypothetical protein
MFAHQFFQVSVSGLSAANLIPTGSSEALGVSPAALGDRVVLEKRSAPSHPMYKGVPEKVEVGFNPTKLSYDNEDF